MPKRSKRALRRRGAINKAVGLIRGGLAKPNLAKTSTVVLEGVISQERRNTPLARAAAAELASRTVGRAFKRAGKSPSFKVR